MSGDPTEGELRSLDPELQPIAFFMVATLRGYGVPAIITSGRRSVQHNAAVGGAGNSRHLLGRAFDLGFLGYRSEDVPWGYWAVIGGWGEQLGLRWGGRFSEPDVVHFDLSGTAAGSI